ncbi:hypothetical protein COCNU_08G005190 [Cocos nucifera]|uniref:Uncharacterized protein n=1 Tax=Cocos nucifera TaxID=13894 RepID=A0A8K0IHE2_COCNU|nr:hypothetical protein COCNU_08G005190 [Cocos nucifera]
MEMNPIIGKVNVRRGSVVDEFVEGSHCIAGSDSIKLRAARSELTKVCKKVNVEIRHLKEALVKAEAKKVKAKANKEAEKKRRETVESKVTEVEKRAKD